MYIMITISYNLKQSWRNCIILLEVTDMFIFPFLTLSDTTPSPEPPCPPETLVNGVCPPTDEITPVPGPPPPDCPEAGPELCGEEPPPEDGPDPGGDGNDNDGSGSGNGNEDGNGEDDSNGNGDNQGGSNGNGGEPFDDRPFFNWH
jgi:hypothetical protein